MAHLIKRGKQLVVKWDSLSTFALNGVIKVKIEH